MKVVIDGSTVAEASEAELVEIEGNWYFPPSSIVDGVLSPSETPYTCPWKGVCAYQNVTTAAGTRNDGAWSYPAPDASAIKRVGKDFSGYVTFAKPVSFE
ncbi:MAG: uncharacterized protein JWQ81_7826 [Amycolatopsis sp.]|jgi:uncharacterized protein (DUF427 family)|uniref:DUF427 domain-containing protein n=1 Tax=Amycolatopsis sp. TaxID=37632 RepID=UPI002614E0B5|nr:DUF427 domain-containing protein [Amycolatopsis sp.]MCU1687087.1 uncharacterized protein [Amycolatopsis sp.]